MVRGASFHSGLRHETADQLRKDADPFFTSETEVKEIDEGDINNLHPIDITKRNFQLFF
jgi:hypothetical protein